MSVPLHLTHLLQYAFEYKLLESKQSKYTKDKTGE